MSSALERRIGRRAFLQGCAVTGAVVVGLTGTCPAAAAAPGGSRFAVLQDLTKCIGCRRCEAACNRVNSLPAPATSFEDPSVFAETRQPSDHAYTVVNRYESAAWTQPIFRKVQCSHCEEPACASACPVGALRKTADGPVVFDRDACIGCGYCIAACPFGIPAFDHPAPGKVAISKCTLCAGRVAAGWEPACTEACPVDAIVFGERSALITAAKERIAAEPTRYVDHVYGEQELGGTSWLYVSGTPFADVGFPAVGTSAATLTGGPRPILTLPRALTPLFAAGLALGAVVALRVRRGADQVVGRDAIRFSLYQRLVHWALALGFVLALATGAWILHLFGLGTSADQLPALYTVHFIGAGLITFAAVAFATSSRVRGESALLPGWRDVSPAVARLFTYLGVYGERGFLGMVWPRRWRRGTQQLLATAGIRQREREEKFLAAQKVLSFTPLATVSVIVIVTGLIKAMRYLVDVPTGLVVWSTWLHDLSIWLVLVILGAHLAATFLVPRNWSGIRAMVTGRMHLRVIEDEFPAWADELRSRNAPPPGAEKAG